MKERKTENDGNFDGIYLYKPGVELPNLYHFANQIVIFVLSIDQNNNCLWIYKERKSLDLEEKPIRNRPIHIQQRRSLHPRTQRADKHKHVPKQKILRPLAIMQSNKAKEKLHRHNKKQPYFPLTKRVQHERPKTRINKIPTVIRLNLIAVKIRIQHAHPHRQVSYPS